MHEVRTLEEAVANLTAQQLAEFRQWFAEFDAHAWDEQLESDAAAGKLDALASEALSDYKSGKARTL